MFQVEIKQSVGSVQLSVALTRGEISRVQTITVRRDDVWAITSTRRHIIKQFLYDVIQDDFLSAIVDEMIERVCLYEDADWKRRHHYDDDDDGDDDYGDDDYDDDYGDTVSSVVD